MRFHSWRRHHIKDQRNTELVFMASMKSFIEDPLLGLEGPVGGDWCFIKAGLVKRLTARLQSGYVPQDSNLVTSGFNKANHI
jgi:hypothetical protein